MKLREQCITDFRNELMRSGTLTVLLTNAIASKIGLSASEFETIDIIRNRQPITAGELARACGLTTGAITGLVDRLQRKGFVTRRRDEQDRRRVYVETVDDHERWKVIRDGYQPLATMLREYVDTLSDEDVARLARQYQAMNDRVEEVIGGMHDETHQSTR